MAERPILVAGRTGQLATDLVEAAGSRGIPLVALGRPDLDITDGTSVARAVERFAPAAVINAAAYTVVDKAEAEPDLAFALNRDGPAHLARACADAGIPLVHISTDQVFDGSKDGPHVEGDTPRPLCVYGRSKLAGEEAVAAASDAHLIVRVSWVFGPSADNFVKKLLAWARDRDTLTIISDQRGKPTYAPGLAEALLILAGRMVAPAEDASRRPEGLLHLAGASAMSRYEQALLVMKASGARGGPTARIEPVLTRDFPTPARRPLNAVLDTSRAAERYGIILGRFEDDLAATLDRLIRRPVGAAS
jgi:dTDP-4-dehydrorhamnose reductase